MGMLAKVTPSLAGVPTLLYKVPAGLQAVVNLNLFSRKSEVTGLVALVDSADHSVSAVSVVNGGTGMIAFPALSFNGDNTTTAVATVSTMKLTEGQVLLGGNGYAVGDIVTLTIDSATTAVKATMRVTKVDGSGTVGALVPENPSSFTGLGIPPNTYHEATTTGGSGSGLTITRIKFGIETVTLTAGGNGYKTVPTVTSSLGTGVVIAAELTTVIEDIDYIDGQTFPFNGSLERTGIVLSAGQSLYVVSDQPKGINAHVWGFEKIA